MFVPQSEGCRWTRWTPDLLLGGISLSSSPRVLPFPSFRYPVPPRIAKSTMAAAAAVSPMFLLRSCRALRVCPTVINVALRPAGRPFGAPLTLLTPHTRSSRQITSAVDEEAAARAAVASAESGGPTIFDKIISKEISSTIVYEDDKVLAFKDISPQAPVHVLVIPKVRDGLTQLGKAELRHEDILGHLLYAAKLVAEKEGIVDGFRVVINSGASACQSVYHLHLHVLGGRQMKWPPG